MQIIFNGTYKGFNSALNVGDIVDVENNGKAVVTEILKISRPRRYGQEIYVKWTGLCQLLNRPITGYTDEKQNEYTIAYDMAHDAEHVFSQLHVGEIIMFENNKSIRIDEIEQYDFDFIDIRMNVIATTVPEMPFDWVNQRRIDNEVKQRGWRVVKVRSPKLRVKEATHE